MYAIRRIEVFIIEDLDLGVYSDSVLEKQMLHEPSGWNVPRERSDACVGNRLGRPHHGRGTD